MFVLTNKQPPLANKLEKVRESDDLFRTMAVNKSDLVNMDSIIAKIEFICLHVCFEVPRKQRNEGL